MSEPLNAPNVKSKLGTLSDKLKAQMINGTGKVKQKVVEVDQFRFITENRIYNNILERKSVGFAKNVNGSVMLKINEVDVYGDWVTGYYVKIEDEEYIYTGDKNTNLALSDDHGVVYYPDCKFKIIPGTKCVLSDYVDTTGHPIKENDIVIMNDIKYIVRIRDGAFCFLNPENIMIENGVIPHQCFHSMFAISADQHWRRNRAHNVAIIGNVFENKDVFKHLDSESKYDLKGLYRAFIPAIIKTMPDNVVIHRSGDFFFNKCYGKWVVGKLIFGGYCAGEPRWFIDPEDNDTIALRQVLTDTITKYIGEVDKDGNMIFQNDIIKIPDYNLDSSVTVTEHNQNIDYMKYQIIGNSFQSLKLMKKIRRAKKKASKKSTT